MTDVEDKTEFKFSELSDKAKDAARDTYRADDYPGYEWWDSTYEDAVRMGALIGIEISTTSHLFGKDNRVSKTIDISFSGFCSQGDGASFEGNYRHVPDALLKIQEETNDKELIRIAQELTLLQLTRRLQGLEPFSAKIDRGYSSGSSCHSGTMVVDISVDEEEVEYTDDIDDEVTQLMRDFADWIYNNLEAEYDYLCSDKYVDERLEDDTFDEEGTLL